MTCLPDKRLLRLLAALAMMLFVGDLAADSISDLIGQHCVAEMSDSSPSHEQTPCSHCSCAAHAGSVVVEDFTLRLTTDLQSQDRPRVIDIGRPPRLAASIDHPPQLG